MSDHDNQIRQLFKGGGLLLVGLIVQLGISFFGKLIVARGLTVRDYGGISLGLAIASIAGTVLTLGLNEGVARYLPRYDSPADKRGVLIAAFSIAVPLSAFSGIVVVIGAPILAALFNNPDVAPVLQVFGLVIPSIVVFRLVIATIQGQQRSVPKVVIENLIRPISRLAVLGVVLLIGITAVRVAWSYFFGWFVPILVGFIYLYRDTNLFALGEKWNFKHRELLRFSIPLLLSATLSIVYGDLDTALLGYFSETTAPVGVYNVAYPLGTLLNTALVAFGFMFMPIMSELHAEGAFDRINRIYQVVTKWVFTVTFPVFLVLAFFSERVISLTFGPKYASGGLALAILSVGFFVNSVMGLNREALISFGLTKIKLYLDAGSAVLNFTLNLFLIPRFGLLGAATATTVTYVTLNILTSVYLYVRTEIVPFGGTIPRITLIGGSSFLLVYLGIRELLVPRVPVLVGGYIGFLLLYAIAVFRLGGIGREEVMLVKSVEERFGIDLEYGKRWIRRVMPREE